jgi:predicted DNA-binding transcriptional regulator AlpA
MPDVYLLPIEAATYLRVAVKTLTKWRGQGKGPPYRKVAGTRIRYVQSELDDWMEAQSVIPGTTVDDPGSGPGQALPTPPTTRAAVHALPPRRRGTRAKY